MVRGGGMGRGDEDEKNIKLEKRKEDKYGKLDENWR